MQTNSLCIVVLQMLSKFQHMQPVAVASSPATLNQLWIRIIDMILSGNSNLLFAAIFLCARHKRGVGYRNGLIYAIVYCVACAISNFVAAANIYYNNFRLLAIVQPVVTAIKIAFVAYCWWNFANFVVTLRRSQFGDSVVKELQAEAEQRRMQLAVVNESIEEQSTLMLSRISRGHDDGIHHTPGASVGGVSH